jgi:hypothetical protein
MSGDDTRSEYVRGLRLLADVIEQHPELPLPMAGDSEWSPVRWYFTVADDPRAEMAAAARALPVAGRWLKEYGEDDPAGEHKARLDMSGMLAGLHVELVAYRDDVCTRIVTGTEDREFDEVVTPAVTRKVKRPVEIVEWQCGPVLAAAEDGTR